MNDSLRPLPRASEPSNVVSSALASSSDSSDSYNGDDARRFLREWRAAQNRYSKVTQENGQLEIRLGVSQAALHAAEEEASAVQARLAESDAMVAGKTNSRNTLLQFPLSFMLTTLLFLQSTALIVQLESLQLAANVAVDVVNARGSLINARLNDVLAHV